MKGVIYNQSINQTLTISLGILYSTIIYVYISNFGGPGFRAFVETSWVEVISMIIFIGSVFLGYLNIKFYSAVLVFVALALPASVDNLLPSVLITSNTDNREVFFPLITHIDIYLIFGIIRYWKTKKQNHSNPKRSKPLLFLIIALAAMLLSITANLLSHLNYLDWGLILSHSFHFRYLALMLILFYNTNVSKERYYFLYGIIFSFVFLLIEATYYTIVIRDSSRLLSGSLRVNTFASILCSICCYFSYLLIRNKLNIRYFFLVIILLVGVFMTKTRSAMFIYVFYCVFELFIYFLDKKSKKINTGIILGVFTVVLILTLSNGNRYSFTQLGLKRIDSNKTQLTEIFQFKKNDFNHSLILRLYHFQTSLNMIKQEPLIGIGPGRWNMYKSDYGSENKEMMDAHNDLLAFSSQYGIIVGVMFLLCIYTIPFLNYKRLAPKKEKQNHFLNYLFIVNIVMIFAGISNATLFKHQVFAFLSIITILSFFLGGKIKSEK